MANIIFIESTDLECREKNFRDEAYLNKCMCFPMCPDWRQDSPNISTAHDVAVFLSHFIGFVAAIFTLVISVVRYKKM